jgi:glycerophosphoryl diester phosphodiesterase
MHRIFAAALAALAFGCTDGAPKGDDERPFRDHFFMSHEGTLNIAHRGGVREFPEHTLFAYEGALAAGADVLEVDVHLSSDGELVVLHDATVDRTTDGEGSVAELDLESIQALDAAYWFTTDGGATYPERGMGHHIPTMREVFEAFPDAPYVIEIKPSSTLAAETLAALIRELELEHQVAVASFSPPVVEELRVTAPEILTAFTLGEAIAFATLAPASEGSYAPPTPLIQLPHDSATTEVVDRARRLGIRVHVFTVNDEVTMQAFIDRAVDGIMTDRPSLLSSLL